MSQSINEDKKYISEIRDSSGNEYKIINNRIEAPTYVSGTFYHPGDQVYKDDVLYTYVGYDSRSVYDNSFSYMFEKANFAKRSGTLKAVGKITYKTDNARYLEIYENISDGYYSYFDSSYFKKLKQGDLIVVRFQEDTVIPASTKVIEIINAQENGSYCFSADVSWPGVSCHYKSKQDYTIPANEAAIFRITTFGINNGEGQYTLNDCLYIGSTTDVHNYHDPSKQDKEEGKGLSTNDFTNEYKSKVDGAQIALSKESYKVLIDEFNAMEEAKGLLVGQNIYIQTIEVPDLWISSIEQTKQTYTYTTDQALIDAIKLNGSQQIGFYKVSILETAKVDLNGYYTKTETDGKVDLKMNKANPVGTGSFSLNRFPNSNVGSNSTTLCNNNTASGSCSMANGSFTKALGFASHSEGYETEANGGYSHAEGQGTYANKTQLTSGNYNYKLSGVYYEPNSYFINMKYISGQTEYTAERKWLPTEDDPTPETSIVVNIIGSKDDTTQQISLQKNIDFILSNNNYTLTLTSTALQKVSSWSTVNYINKQSNPRTPHGYYTVVGNGLAHERSNAYALSCDGTGRYKGDVYVECNADSTEGIRLAKVSEIKTNFNQLEGTVTNSQLDGEISNDKLVNKSIIIAGSSVSLGESISAETLKSNLGITNVMHYIGKTTTTIADGSTTNPITINGSPVTAVSGDVVIDNSNDQEYVWNGAWQKLGGSSSYKVKQTAVPSPSASGTATAFIDTISQDINGNITVTKKNIIDNDTKNTAGAIDTTDKIYLIGAKTQDTNPQTYSNSNIYVNNNSLTVGSRKLNSVIGNYSSVLGCECEASGEMSFAEGLETLSSGEGSHAEGIGTRATNWGSHAEGARQFLYGDQYILASGKGAHAEGYVDASRASDTDHIVASGDGSHAEGINTQATGSACHAEGERTIAAGSYCHAEGYMTKTMGSNQHVEGKCNVTNVDALHIVGNGSRDQDRSNAYLLDKYGTGRYKGDVYVKCNADSTDGSRLATEKYVDARIPAYPSSDGEYILQCSIVDGVASVSWISKE